MHPSWVAEVVRPGNFSLTHLGMDLLPQVVGRIMHIQFPKHTGFCRSAFCIVDPWLTLGEQHMTCYM
jgi:hypothetical protein